MVEPRTMVMEFLLTHTATQSAFIGDPTQTLKAPAPEMPSIEQATGPRVVPDATVLGRGGMGVIHGGQQTRLSRSVAVKTLSLETRDKRDAREGLLLEALLTGALEHPGIVPVYDIDADADGRPLVALKRIEGTPWSTLMHKESTAKVHGAADLLEWNLSVVMRVCDALDYAHSRGIIHRDVKPANVMVGSFGEVYLLDWGLAVTTRADADPRFPRASRHGGIVGTPAYMAPELLQREVAKQGPATDIYLLGAVLYEVLAGHVPHRGADLVTLLDSVLHGPPKLPAGTPEALVQLVERCMALEPGERPTSCGEVKAAIVAYLARRGSERIAEAAFNAVTSLEQLAQEPEPDKQSVHQAVRLFSEARFGFLQASVAGSDGTSPEAGAPFDDGLRRALRAGVQVALSAGSTDVAMAFVSESDNPPLDVVQRVERAAEEADEEWRSLRATAHDQDLRIGRRMRTMIILGTTVPGALLGLFFHVTVVARGEVRSFVSGLVSGGIFLAGTIAFRFVLARHLNNAINRKFYNVIMTSLAALLIMRGSLMVLGMPPQLADTFALFVWWLSSMTFVTNIDVRMAPASICYLLSFAVSVRWPDLRLIAQSVGHLGLAANALWVWVLRPQRPSTSLRAWAAQSGPTGPAAPTTAAPKAAPTAAPTAARKG